MRVLRTAGSALVLLCAVQGALVAQAPSLSLDRAIELARSGNPQYRTALNNLDLGVPETRQAWGAFLPGLSLNAGTNGGFVRQLVGTDDFGNPVANPNAQTRYTSGSQQGLSLSLPLFEGGRRFHALGQARASGQARRWTATAELLRVTLSVERDFFGAQRQQELLAVESGLLEELRRDREATERLFALAGKTRSDLLGAELSVRQQEGRMRAVTGERDKAMLSLLAAVGAPSDSIGGVEPVEIAVFQPTAEDLGALVGFALGGNATVRSAESEARASDAATAAARAARWPTLRLSGSMGRGAFAPDGEALFDLSPNDQSSGSLQLSINVPLFSQFQTSYQIAQADVALRNARESVRQRRLEVERDVRRAWIDLRNAHDQVESTGSAQEVADERLRLVREEYRLAVKSFEELQSAVRGAAEARREAVGARYDFAVARIALEEAVGARLDQTGTARQD